MRKKMLLNNNWFFFDGYSKDLEKYPIDNNLEIVNLPHITSEITYNYINLSTIQKTVTYWHNLYFEDEYKDKIIFIDFEGVMAYARVYINGKFAGEHKGGYTPFSVRIDHLYDWESSENNICVIADSTERSEIPPFGSQIDYLSYSGIYRDVFIRVCDPLYIERFKIECENPLDESPILQLKIYLANLQRNIYGTQCQVTLNIYDKNHEEVYSDTTHYLLEKNKNEYLFATKPIPGLQKWDIDNPVLYIATVTITNGEYQDSYVDRFGIREVRFTPQGFYLNNKRIKLLGLNRHSSFPYVGYAMPKRVLERDAEILKNELHLNIVRTSHYPQSPHFLRKCDEIGLLVFEEIPGWQHIGEGEWKDIIKQNVVEMIKRDWNHPAIVLWGVRVNESPDDDNLYIDTNSLAHSLDPTRQTGGVRCITNSNLLEDVYTFNDFMHYGNDQSLHKQQEVTGLNEDVPYLVTEYCGHMYPVKKFDQEERVNEHVLRHICILNQMYGDGSISGAIGWCAFDYNTHKDFGSGDKICYHGVMDMFRLPKFTASVYKSQVSPEKEIILDPVTYWSRGERSKGGIVPLVILTNCDYVDLSIDGNNKINQLFPSFDLFPHLPHPPAVLNAEEAGVDEWGAWGHEWNDCTFIGYINNKPVIERKFTASPIPSKLEVIPDYIFLSASQKDATRIVVRLLDQCGNRLWFLHEVIKIKTEGPVKIIGPDEIVTICGETAFWIESINKKGDVTVTVSTRILGKETVTLSVNDM